MMNIGVFCGSSRGINIAFTNDAIRLGNLFVEQKKTMIYGGGNVGLMGVIADTMVNQQGKVIGIIPEHIMELEIAHKSLNELIVVKNMADRKIKMIEMSDAFIALSGGYGTLDEVMEVLTSNQLRLTEKPIGLLNTNGFFNHLLAFFKHGVKEGFIRKEHFNQLYVSNHPEDLLLKMSQFRSVDIEKWIDDIKSA